MQLDLPFGPWKKMVSAQWGDYPLTIYQNPDRLMLLSLFEKQSEKVQGVLLFLKKGFVLDGDPSKFALSQRRDMVLITKISRDNQERYLLLSSSPMYIEYNMDSLVKAVSDQHAELDNLSRATVEILRSYDCKATDFLLVPEDKLSALMGDPYSLFSFFSMSPGAGGQGGPMVIPKSSKFLFGVDKAGTPQECRVGSLRCTQVTGGITKNRLHALHIAVEGALLNNIPVIIFDTKGALSGLALPNKDSSNYETYHVKSIPIGFPFKQYELDKGLFIDLANLSSDLFLESFGLEKSDIAAVIKKVYSGKEGSFSSISDLIVELSQMKDSPEASKYTINKAIRAVEVIQKSYPNVFSKNTANDFYGSEGLGKVIHINLYGQPPELSALAIYSIVKPLGKTVSTGLRILLVFEQDASLLSDELVNKLSELTNKGVGVAIQGEHELDLVRLGKSTMKVEFVDLDCVLTEEGEKQKRLKIRPALSHDSE